MAKGKKWLLVKAFNGLPKRTDLEMQEFDIPDVMHGEVLLQTSWLSVDPYQRLRSEEGDIMDGEIIAKVVESKDHNFKVGDYVVARTGWVTHAVIPGKDTLGMPPIPEGAPLSLGLGTLGMPGLTAYLGLLEVCDLRPTDTVYVNAAAGAVGSVVGQIAKIKGAKVIGSAGSDEKVEYLKTELRFDEAYSYKKVTPDKLKEELNRLAPNGIDIFFEMVGGEASSVIYSHMNKNGRVGIFGNISNYNCSPRKGTEVPTSLQESLSLRIQKFGVFNHYDRRKESLEQLARWVEEEKIKYKEHIYTGFDSMFDAFIAIFDGKNFGKAVVKL